MWILLWCVSMSPCGYEHVVSAYLHVDIDMECIHVSFWIGDMKCLQVTKWIHTWIVLMSPCVTWSV